MPKKTNEKVSKKEVVCNAGGYCAYRTLGSMFAHCSYTDYCDYQLPKDSRDTNKLEELKEK